MIGSSELLHALSSFSVSFLGYILAITAENNKTRYIAVFFMAAGVLVIFWLDQLPADLTFS